VPEQGDGKGRRGHGQWQAQQALAQRASMALGHIGHQVGAAGQCQCAGEAAYGGGDVALQAQGFQCLVHRLLARAAVGDGNVPGCGIGFWAERVLGQRVAGAVDPETGVVYLSAENIAPDELTGFLKHEVGVHQAQLGLNQPKSRAARLAHALARLVGARQILEEPSFNDALAQLQRMRGISKPVQAAYSAAEKAMGNLNQSPELLHEEALAYLVQNHPQTSLAQKILAAVRAFLYKAGLKINLTENDLQALAVSALRGVAQGKVRPGTVSRGVMGRERFAIANLRPLTPEQQAAMDKIGRREPQGWGMRFTGLRDRIGLKLRQAIADALTGNAAA